MFKRLLFIKIKKVLKISQGIPEGIPFLFLETFKIRKVVCRVFNVLMIQLRLSIKSSAAFFVLLFVWSTV